MIYLLLMIITSVAAQTCHVDNSRHFKSKPANMGKTPTGTPLCETVQTGSCSSVFGSDTACVEKPPADKLWSAQQYLDVMSALDYEGPMGLLIRALPPYQECGFNHTDNYTKTCQQGFRRKAASPGCINDLKRFLCMGGARPCNAGATAAEDTRASIPCEWCQKMVTGQTNECSTAASPFNFKESYSTIDRNTLCFDIADQLEYIENTFGGINVIAIMLDKPSLRTERQFEWKATERHKRFRREPTIKLVDMLSWGMNSALKGCSPTKCPINTGMAAGLFSSTQTSFPKSASCPVREDVVDVGGNYGKKMSGSVMGMVLMGVVTMVQFF